MSAARARRSLFDGSVSHAISYKNLLGGGGHAMSLGMSRSPVLMLCKKSVPASPDGTSEREVTADKISEVEMV